MRWTLATVFHCMPRTGLATVTAASERRCGPYAHSAHLGFPPDTSLYTSKRGTSEVVLCCTFTSTLARPRRHAIRCCTSHWS